MASIIIANYRYFIAGGPEKYLFNVKDILEKNGHKTLPFSVKYSSNEPSAYDQYFVSPRDREGRVYYRDISPSFSSTANMIKKAFYSLEAKKNIIRLIRNENADSVYILNFINSLSPSIIDGAKSQGKRVVIRLSDFFLACARYDFLYRGNICEKCLNGCLFNAVFKKCVHESLPASLIRVLSMYFHRILGVYKRVDCFISPSGFLRDKMIESGIKPEKIHHLPTFIDSSVIKPDYKYSNYILYFGRLTRHKGIETLINSARHIKDRSLMIYIAGDASGAYAQGLQELCSKREINNVKFLGFLRDEKLREAVSGARFTVFPCLWYENMPNALLEAFAHGKCAVGSNIGSIPEIIDDGQNGLLFEPGDETDLADKISFLNSRPDLISEYSRNARLKTEQEYNPETHYSRLIKLLL